MFAKTSASKLPKLDNKSKKTSKSKKTPSKSKKNHQLKSHKKTPQPNYLNFYLSEQCINVLQPFKEMRIFPKVLQKPFKDLQQVISAVSSIPPSEQQDPFSEKLQNLRFLTNSQESFIEGFLQTKYSFTKNSNNLQEIYCYSTAKNLLQTQFQEFFEKRSEFLQKQHKIEVKVESKEHTENSFSTTNVSSPMILMQGNCHVGYANNGINTNIGPFHVKFEEENMLNLLKEEDLHNYRYYTIIFF